MKPYAARDSEPVPRPVFGVDIDGTLGEYHAHFLNFARGWLGRQMPPVPYDGSVPLYRWMGVSKTTYRQVKLAYRRGGLKRCLPVYPMAAELTRGLRKRGAMVVICTTRPYLQLDNVEPDTREWLRRNRIQHDSILSGEHKYRELKNRYGVDRVVAVIEDLPEMVRQANACGFFALLPDKPYNRPPLLDGRDWNGLRVEDLHEAAAEAHVLLDHWEKERR